MSSCESKTDLNTAAIRVPDGGVYDESLGVSRQETTPQPVSKNPCFTQETHPTAALQSTLKISECGPKHPLFRPKRIAADDPTLNSCFPVLTHEDAAKARRQYEVGVQTGDRDKIAEAVQALKDSPETNACYPHEPKYEAMLVAQTISDDTAQRSEGQQGVTALSRQDASLPVRLQDLAVSFHSQNPDLLVRVQEALIFMSSSGVETPHELLSSSPSGLLQVGETTDAVALGRELSIPVAAAEEIILPPVIQATAVIPEEPEGTLPRPAASSATHLPAPLQNSHPVSRVAIAPVEIQKNTASHISSARESEHSVFFLPPLKLSLPLNAGALNEYRYALQQPNTSLKHLKSGKDILERLDLLASIPGARERVLIGLKQAFERAAEGMQKPLLFSNLDNDANDAPELHFNGDDTEPTFARYPRARLFAYEPVCTMLTLEFLPDEGVRISLSRDASGNKKNAGALEGQANALPGVPGRAPARPDSEANFGLSWGQGRDRSSDLEILAEVMAPVSPSLFQSGPRLNGLASRTPSSAEHAKEQGGVPPRVASRSDYGERNQGDTDSSGSQKDSQSQGQQQQDQSQHHSGQTESEFQIA